MPLQKEFIVDQVVKKIVGMDDFNFTYYLRECLMRLPIRDLKSIAYEKNLHILKTTANTVLDLKPLLYASGKGDNVLVVFVTNFSKCPPHEIMYIIAHEFAHVCLGHYDKARYVGEESEVEADDLLMKWGFEEELRREKAYNTPHLISRLPTGQLQEMTGSKSHSEDDADPAEDS
jgi:hypothetical protein